MSDHFALFKPGFQERVERRSLLKRRMEQDKGMLMTAADAVVKWGNNDRVGEIVTNMGLGITVASFSAMTASAMQLTQVASLSPLQAAAGVVLLGGVAVGASVMAVATGAGLAVGAAHTVQWVGDRLSLREAVEKQREGTILVRPSSGMRFQG